MEVLLIDGNGSDTRLARDEIVATFQRPSSPPCLLSPICYMSHALMYHGSFESNFSKMKSGATTFLGSDGSERVIPEWPAEADGLRVGYMEKAGKRFVAVRVLDDKSDVMLGNELLIDPPSHMGYGKRFSAEPTVIEDDVAHSFEIGVEDRRHLLGGNLSAEICEALDVSE